jgi:hypothetical protein
VDPPIWREITVPDSYSLDQLHRCIQLVFEWFDYHLYQFQFEARRFEGADSEMEGEDAAAVPLADLDLATGSTLLYLYDMGDGWEHDIVMRSAQPNMAAGDGPDLLAYVVAGARAAPPEDVGGPPGYERLVTALARRNGPGDQDLIDWVGPDFDPELFDRRASNHALVLATAWQMI